MSEELDQIDELFDQAVDSFPADLQEAALQRLAEWKAALKLIRQLEEKGLEALL